MKKQPPPTFPRGNQGLSVVDGRLINRSGTPMAGITEAAIARKKYAEMKSINTVLSEAEILAAFPNNK